MKNLFYCFSTLALLGCNSSSPYEKYLKEINNVTKESCAAGFTYTFSATNGILTVNYDTPNTEPATCSGKLKDLQFGWNTLDGDVEQGIDHEVTISCENTNNNNCFTCKGGSWPTFRIEIKGEMSAEHLLDNLNYLKQAEQ